MLALAIGLNVTISRSWTRCCSRFPAREGNDRLVFCRSARHLASVGVYADFEDWRVQAQTFEDMAFVASFRPITSATAKAARATCSL